MPWHKVQDGLEEDRLARKGTAFGSTRRGIAYAYSDKYRKKALRLAAMAAMVCVAAVLAAVPALRGGAVS